MNAITHRPGSKAPRPAVPFFGVGALLVLLATMPMQTSSQPDSRLASLQGITKLGVDIQVLPRAAGLPNVNAAALRQNVVAFLQALSIAVDQNLTDAVDSTPVIRVLVDASSGANNLRSLFVETCIRQRVTLNRNQTINSIIADTWRVANPPGSVPIGLEAATINQLLAQQLAAFKNNYNQVNSQSGALPPIDNPAARWVRDSCQFHSVPLPSDSGKFAQAVAADFALLSIPGLPDNANGILDFLDLNSVPFTSPPPQPASGKWVKILSPQAVNDLAKSGWLFVGGLKTISPQEPGNQGLVVVIVANPTAGPNDPPLAYWGRSAGNGRRNAPVSQAFAPNELANVAYYGRKLGN